MLSNHAKQRGAAITRRHETYEDSVMKTLLEEIRAICPEAEATDTFSATRSTPDTIEEARRKVLAKLDKNIEYLKQGEDGSLDEKPDLVYKYEARICKYSVGAKYGNRWLPGLADNGQKFVRNVSEQQLVPALEAIKKYVADGNADESIKEIQAKNMASRRI